jgi:SAM-dependent methyltransferase
MSDWYNECGRPLSSDSWLEAHHRAKLPERTNFAKRIAERAPRRVVDLGCGPGLWLDLCAGLLDKDCELFGFDSDERALETARERARGWVQSSEFKTLDVEARSDAIPEADVFLAFNVFPYVSDPVRLLENIRSKLRPGGCLIVRQYDGALLRVGPLSDQDRRLIDTSLMASVKGSGQFKHYDLDRVFHTIASSSYPSKSIDFEIFRRVAPYPTEFRRYFINTMQWTREYLGDEARDRLDRWLEVRGKDTTRFPSYFLEVDLVAWLS